MTPRRIASLLIATLAVLPAPGTGLVLAQSPTPVAPASAPSLAGVWSLNRDLSSPPGGGLGPAAGSDGGRRPGGMGRGGGRMGGGMGGRRGGGRVGGGQEEMQRLRESMRELLQPAARLTIVQQGDQVTFTDDQGHVRKFAATNKTEKHQLTSATLETRSRWDGGALVTEWKTGRGPTVVRRWRVDPATSHLIVETTMKGGPGGGDRPPVRHVYEPVVDAAIEPR